MTQAAEGGEIHEVSTPVGAVTLWLPDGAELVPDPAVPDGCALWWGSFSLSYGPATGRRADDLLALEQGASRVEVERDETVELEGLAMRELCLRVEHERERHWVAAGEEPSGRREVPEQRELERLRFRFWDAGSSALRAGYRLSTGGSEQGRSTLDRVLDSVELEGEP
jgi:hypothetical protein